MRAPICLALLSAAASAQVNARATTNSYDPASTLAAGVTASDIEVNSNELPLGGVIEWGNAILGLAPGDNVNAFSDGSDIFPSPGPAISPPVNCRRVRVEHTLDPNSIGGPFVSGAECASDGCASDTFATDFVGGAPPVWSQATDALGPNVSPLPNETDLDSISWLERQAFPVYFSVDGPTATALGVTPAHVLVTTAAGGPWMIAWTPVQLGLGPGDDIDALSVMEPVNEACSVPANPQGHVVFSLSRNSPTVAPGGGPGALYEPFGGGVRLWATAQQLDVTPCAGPACPDNINGVRITDPVDPFCMDGSEIDAGGLPWVSLRIDGLAGDAARRVRVGTTTSFSLDAHTLSGVPVAVFGRIGYPCLFDATTVPGLPGTLAFDPFSIGVFDLGLIFSGTSKFYFVPLELDVTLQGVTLSPGSFERTNMICVRVRCS